MAARKSTVSKPTAAPAQNDAPKTDVQTVAPDGAVQATQTVAAPAKAAPAAQGAEAKAGPSKDATQTPACDDSQYEASAPVLTITCLREGGLRRGGRRWPEGKSTIPAAELDALQRAQIEADPLFTVTEGEA